MASETTVTCDVCGVEIDRANYIESGNGRVILELRSFDTHFEDEDWDLCKRCAWPLILSIRRKLAELQREKEQ